MMKTQFPRPWLWQLQSCLFNTAPLVDMVGCNPWDMAHSIWTKVALCTTACCTLMNYGIRHKYANLGISLVMPLYCKLQWLIYYVWSKDWSEEVLAASFTALSCSLSHHERVWIAGKVAPNIHFLQLRISVDSGELEFASTLNCQAT